jgi:hypothetical protein
MHADIARRLPEAIHDSAQRGFMYAQHPRQTVLPDACGVHPQFQVRVNVSIQGHDFALVFDWAAALAECDRGCYAKTQCNLSAKR